MPGKRGLDYRPLSPKRRAAILEETLASAPQRDCLRVFAYGSLMWNPCFEPLEAVPALLEGYRRQFCILTVRARGTPARPGLGPALVPGVGACRGIAYALNPTTLAEDLEALFEREMNTGVYRPTWIEVEAGAQRLHALSFVANSGHAQYCGRLEMHEMAELIAGARGHFGSCRDYLASMVCELNRIGGAEPDLEELLKHVDARLAQSPPR
ncbi:MAG TPA: gamma-glutamylcyclotransferase [Gammaproteobacteria bacterium]|nr:gamma-glutamylcyclotransferase [Gammaproteobacteria bacterium]